MVTNSVFNPFVFIPSLQKHQFFNESGSFLTILVDDESSFREKNLNIEKLESYSGRDLANKKELEGLLSELGLLDSRVFDPRIQNSLDLISSSNELEQIRSSVICKEIGLSESHFLHLFKDEMGVPFRKYILWKKLKRAISLIAIGSKPNLADIALEAGFADSAHLSNVIKASFGLSPREILKNSQFLQE